MYNFILCECCALVLVNDDASGCSCTHSAPLASALNAFVVVNHSESDYAQGHEFCDGCTTALAPFAPVYLAEEMN